MIKTYYINESNDLLGILSVRAINVLKVKNKNELEEKKEAILENIRKHGYRLYGKKTTMEFLRYFNIDPAEIFAEIEQG